MFISTRLRTIVPAFRASKSTIISSTRYQRPVSLSTYPSSLLKKYSSTAAPKGSFYQRVSQKIENQFYFRPHTWFFSGILISIFAAVPIIMATQDYIILSDEETKSAFIPVHHQQHEVEAKINSHPLTVSLRANPAFTESRPTLKINGSYRSSSLTSGVLSGPGKIVVPPFAWSEEGGKSFVSILYLGEDLCGHPGIVHGGLLATLLDEGLARCCFPALPNKIAMTANLTVNYRKPSPAGNYFVLRAKTVKVDGRKAWVEGHIESLPEEGEEPIVMVEASALMIEPKQAKLLMSIVPIK